MIIDESKIAELLGAPDRVDRARLHDILEKALTLNGLSLKEVAYLISLKEDAAWQAIFETAQKVKEAIYGKRIVLFAPLYISNRCNNDCAYCGFRETNTALPRHTLTHDEIVEETQTLIDQGHKRVLLVSAEADQEGIDYILQAIHTIYETHRDQNRIRRVNVNIAALTDDEFKELRKAPIGTYQLFQETYHRPTYREVHLKGKKQDYDFRLQAMDRAMKAGIDDVGVGFLLGLYDWRFELLALLQHAEHLEKTFGAGPHTISVPRIEFADASPLSQHPPFAVSDVEIKKIIAILRLAVPYTGIILSTRETPALRHEALDLGVSQMSAGSSTVPGGYSQGKKSSGQFSLSDERSLDEVIADIVSVGYVPSFCTGCYRKGRTGEDFMSMAKPGHIKHLCLPNALLSFYEYLCDYASPKTHAAGEALIQKEVNALPSPEQQMLKVRMQQIQAGKRDLYI